MNRVQAGFNVRVVAMRLEAEDIVSVELRALDGALLPPFSAGAHIVVTLSAALSRSYSLTNLPGERHRYVIVVHRGAASRGGSRYVHDTLRIGDTLAISEPRNNFELDEAAQESVLIAGGIGITPLWAMIQRLEVLGRPWRLHYAARSRRFAAFLTELQALEAQRPGHVHFHFDDEHQSTVFDMASAIGGASLSAELYCCGPVPMLRAFQEAAGGRPPQRVHLEYFSNDERVSQAGSDFTVVLARSGKRVRIPADVTILDALLKEGVDASYSCREGVCGTCEVRVLSGLPDHRDLILSDAEKAANQSVIICCSRALGDELVLDL